MFIRINAVTMKKEITTFLMLVCISLPLFCQNFNLTLRKKVSFPDESIAGVWGYEKNGREYALVAGSDNLRILDVTDPEKTPSPIVKLPMASDWGKEVRTFRNFAYVSAENGPGLVIYDLSNLPASQPASYPKKVISQVNGHTFSVHTLHVDTTAGTLYLNGTSKGTLVFNLLPDPFSPVFAGVYDEFYGIHDGYVDNDTLYAAHINQGFVAVVDMHDKSNPEVLSTFETPGKFPHNTWLTRDRRHLLAADEISNGFVSLWDIANLDDIREMSRFRPTPGSGSVPHNAFILNDYAFASWYRDGLILLDLTRPENVVQVGRYDTCPLAGDSYDGSWGNYPYLPSGNVLVTDKVEGLFILTPTYIRACYLEGKVKDAVSDNPLPGVKVFIFDGDQVEPTLSSMQGEYKTGQAKTGEFEVLFYKEGYRPLLRKAELKPGEVTLLDVELVPLSMPGDDVPILLVAAENNQPLGNIEVVFRNEVLQFQVKTDAKGWVKVPVVYTDSFDVFPAIWGRLPSKGIVIDPVRPPVVRLVQGYYDDFHFDFGWESEGDAERGTWEKGEIEVEQFFSTPANDVLNDLGRQCFTTGLTTPANNSWIDVHNGTARLVSPLITLDGYRSPYLRFSYWQNSEDTLQGLSVFLENEHSRIKLWRTGQNKPIWFSSPEILLPAKEGGWRVVFEARDTIDDWEWGWLDAGLDVVEIRDGQPSPAQPFEELQVGVFPNPFHDKLLVRCVLPDNGLPADWQLFDLAGKQVQAGRINTEAAVITLTPDVANGMYFFHIQQNGNPGQTIKVVKF